MRRHGLLTCSNVPAAAAPKTGTRWSAGRYGSVEVQTALSTAESDMDILCESSIGCENHLKESRRAVVLEEPQVQRLGYLELLNNVVVTGI